MAAPAVPPALATSRSRHRAAVPELYLQTTPPHKWSDHCVEGFSSALWPESGALLPDPELAAQLASPIVSLSDQFTRDNTTVASTHSTNANIPASPAGHQASPAEATDGATAARPARAVLAARDRRVARQPPTPAIFPLGYPPSDPSFNQQLHLPSGSLPISTANPDPRTAYQNLQSSPSPSFSLRDYQHRRRRSRWKQDLLQLCNPRYCCLHHEPQPSSPVCHPLSTEHLGAPTTTGRPAFTNMNTEDPHDIAAQQAAAKDYQPAHDSPLIGARLPCENITNEYAKADPVYVEKTLALPQTYSEYRPVRGDGNCGWRAIGFSYFEKLAESGDLAKIQTELTRLTAYNQSLESVGDYNYWEDFAEPAMELLADLQPLAADKEASLALVLERWNDENVTNAIIYYLRLLAATYLKEHAADYDPFVPSGHGVQGHCETVIQPVNREIEHLGIVALSNLLLKPIGVVLEIAYLDRSEGSTVNQYRFPEEANGEDPTALGPIIHLLYRPEHYDILYRDKKPGSTAESTQGLVYQVNRVELLPTSLGIDHIPAMSGISAMPEMDFDILSSIIPNYFDVGHGSSISPPSATDPLPDNFTPQQSSWGPRYDEGMSVASSSMVPSSVTGISTNPSTPMTPASSIVAPPVATIVPSATQPASGNNADCQIRFSNAQYDYDGISDQLQVQTSTFKNSVYNTAHFRNPNFQPEECHPDGDPSDKRFSGKKKKRQDS
ncbi:hypothetical protein NLU13_2424 [Sarocladium strictum]|uniref:ubiquitinyl hydrolase 1 n=1 Tax=Sarocladium strictum TaxID=5046 RepID=A0AA39LD96_SARSR|nr:hypothetical protein NLU13_2424 [Sarocladium strictum]